MTTELSTGAVLGVLVTPLLWLLALRMLRVTFTAPRRGRRPRGHAERPVPVTTAGDVARLLAPALDPEMVRFVTRTAGQNGIAELTLWDFGRMFGPVLLAVAVAAHATEAELQSQLREGRIRDLQAYLVFASASGLAVDRGPIGPDVGWGWTP